MVALTISELTKDYAVGFWRKKIRVLDHLNLQIQRGEVFGFLGPNGAGKTTTLKLITGLIHPTKGEARVLDGSPNNRGIKEKIGFLPENPQFYRYLSGLELLYFYGRLFPLKEKELKSRIDGLLDLVRLSGARNLSLSKYSKGMIQRLGLAQALLNDPEILLLDEPMTGLDPIGRKRVVDILLNLKAQGKTIFFSSHILSDVERISDRVGILNKGRLIKEGKVADLLRKEGQEKKDLEEIYTEAIGGGGLEE